MDAFFFSTEVFNENGRIDRICEHRLPGVGTILGVPLVGAVDVHGKGNNDGNGRVQASGTNTKYLGGGKVKGRSLYLAAYDISYPPRLIATLKAVRCHATGGQKSVYECFLNREERRSLLYRVEGLIDLGCDRFFLLRLDVRSAYRTLGKGVPPIDGDFFYQG